MKRGLSGYRYIKVINRIGPKVGYAKYKRVLEGTERSKRWIERLSESRIVTD